jgi:transposase InsO family protein
MRANWPLNDRRRRGVRKVERRRWQVVNTKAIPGIGAEFETMVESGVNIA